MASTCSFRGRVSRTIPLLPRYWLPALQTASTPSSRVIWCSTFWCTARTSNPSVSHWWWSLSPARVRRWRLRLARRPTQARRHQRPLARRPTVPLVCRQTRPVSLHRPSSCARGSKRLPIGKRSCLVVPLTWLYLLILLRTSPLHRIELNHEIELWSSHSPCLAGHFALVGL